MKKSLVLLTGQLLIIFSIGAMADEKAGELILLNTTPRHERRWGESSFTLYRIHRNTSKHQLRAIITERIDLGL